MLKNNLTDVNISNLSINNTNNTKVSSINISKSQINTNKDFIKNNTTTEVLDLTSLMGTKPMEKMKPLVVEQNNLNTNIERITQFKGYGLIDSDIERLMSNEITIDELINEINNDENTDRYRKLLEASYIRNNLKLEYNSIEELKQAIEENKISSDYKQIIDMMNSSLDFEINQIRKYTVKSDFQSNNKINESKLTEELTKKFEEANINTVTDKAGIAMFFVGRINNPNYEPQYEIHYPNGIVDKRPIRVGDDENLMDYYKWMQYITKEEKEVINYIYNKEGAEAVYDYLVDKNEKNTLSDQLDIRWLEDRTKKDQEFAKEHPVLSSVASVLVTPFEGIKASFQSLNSGDHELRRTNVYSSGNVYRGTVSSILKEKYGGLASGIYDIGMSMADTGALIAVGTVTGGSGTVFASAALMGSRSYVSTLNDGLDRGLSKDDAIKLATTSAIVETAMEGYSVGHLLNLEGKLGKATMKLTEKIGNKFEDAAAKKFATNITYALSNSMSQGVVEAEEEMSTEILNLFADKVIAKDKSRIEMAAKEYRQQGLSDDEISMRLFKDFGSDVLQAGVGGFVSGGIFGGVAGAKTIHNNNLVQNNTSTISTKNIKNNIETTKQVKSKSQKVMEGPKKSADIQKVVDEINIPKVDNLELSTNADSILKNKVSLVKSSAVIGTEIPTYVNKMLYKSIRKDENFMQGCIENGLYHFTSEENLDKIIDSNYIKPSGNLLSYGKKKAFMFSGIPSVENLCMNYGLEPKLTAIKINPKYEDLLDNKFKFRFFDDLAVGYEGKLSLENYDVQKKYLVLSEENGTLKYKEVSKEQYDNFDYSNSEIFKNKSKQAIYGTLIGLTTITDNITKKVGNVISKGKSIGLVNDYEAQLDSVNAAVVNGEVKSNIVNKVINKIKNKFEKGDISTEKLVDITEKLSDDYSTDKLPEIVDFGGDVNKWSEFVHNSNLKANIDGITFVSQTPEGLQKLTNFYEELKNNTNTSSKYFLDFLQTKGLYITDFAYKLNKNAYHCQGIIYLDSEILENLYFSTFYHEGGHFVDYLSNYISTTAYKDLINDMRSDIDKVNERIDYFKMSYDNFVQQLQAKLEKNRENDILELEEKLRQEYDFSKYTYEQQQDFVNMKYKDFCRKICSREAWENGYAAVSDIFDAITEGKNKVLPFLHDADYYSNSNKALVEILAEISDLYNNGNMDLLDQFFPKEVRKRLVDTYEDLIGVTSIKNIMKVIKQTQSNIDDALLDYVVNHDNSVFKSEIRERLTKYDENKIKKYITSYGVVDGYLEKAREIMDNKYGQNAFYQSLENYLETGNISVFTREGNVRELIGLLNPDQINIYLNEYNQDSSIQLLDSIKSKMGYLKKFQDNIDDAILDYLINHDNSVFKDDRISNFVNKFTTDYALKVYITSDGVVENYLKKAQEIMDNKYGKSAFYQSLEDYLETGNISVFTREGNVRGLISLLNQDQIMNYLKENKQKYTSLNNENIQNQVQDEMIGYITKSNNEIINEYVTNLQNRNMTFAQFLQSNGINTTSFKNRLDLAIKFGDSKLYTLEKLKEIQNNPNTSDVAKVELTNLIEKYKHMTVGNYTIIDMLNDCSSYFDEDTINKIIEINNTGIADRISELYSKKQKDAIFNYTKCGGLEINAWLNDLPLLANRNVKTRDVYKTLDELQDAISNAGGNKKLTSVDGKITDELDSLIKNTNYDDAILTYRGIQDLYVEGQKIDVSQLKIGDKFSSHGYQSSSVLQENCYGLKKTSDPQDIILEITILPNSGSAAYIENIAGVRNYCQTEMIIKRDAEMVVVDDPYQKIVNGKIKTFVPVVVK